MMKPKKRLNSFILLFGFFLLILKSVFASDTILAQYAWIREAPPTIKIMAAYLEIKNASNDERVLIAAESEEFERIEFHLSQISDGIARMRQQNSIIIAPNSTFIFKPEAYHLMLFNPSTPMREGRSTSIRLTFKNGETHVFEAVVKKSDSNSSLHQHHRL